ncbi:MAG TPA: hypothetical protein VMW24_11030 [Sedimentisphaerales bacterium]|nr:hypothetical protein [Sedimentisphaerales bacterium]
MQYKVIRPFRWDGNVRMPGQIVEMDISQAGRLRIMGLIGQVEQAVAPKERAIRKPSERRTRKPRKEKREAAIDKPQSEENKENGAESGNTSGD